MAQLYYFKKRCLQEEWGAVGVQIDKYMDTSIQKMKTSVVLAYRADAFSVLKKQNCNNGTEQSVEGDCDEGQGLHGVST